VLVEGKAIDLRQDGDGECVSAHSADALCVVTRALIFVCVFIVYACARVRAVDYGEERKSTMLLRPPISLLSDVGSGMRDEGESQFKISNCVVHTSGALLLEDKGQNVVDRNFERVRSAVSDLPFGSPKVVMGAARSADSGVQHELQSAEDASLQMRPHALNFGAEAHPGGEAAQLDDGRRGSTRAGGAPSARSDMCLCAFFSRAGGSDGGDNYNYGPYLGREASASADVVGEEDPWALLVSTRRRANERLILATRSPCLVLEVAVVYKNGGANAGSPRRLAHHPRPPAQEGAPAKGCGGAQDVGSLCHLEGLGSAL
jgi:hypothetical protein